MVLQALRSFVLIFFVFSSSAYSFDMSSIPDFKCPTATELDFTEREACMFMLMSKSIASMSGNNAQLLTGTTSSLIQEEKKFGQYGQSAFLFMSKLDKAKALLLEKTSSNIAQAGDMLLSNSDALLLYIQLQRTIIDNQVTINDYLLKENRKR